MNARLRVKLKFRRTNHLVADSTGLPGKAATVFRPEARQTWSLESFIVSMKDSNWPARGTLLAVALLIRPADMSIRRLPQAMVRVAGRFVPARDSASPGRQLAGQKIRSARQQACRGLSNGESGCNCPNVLRALVCARGAAC